MVVSHSSSEKFLKDVSSDKYIKKILSLDKNSGSFKEKIDGKDYLVTYVASGVLNWKFISLTPYHSVVITLQKVGLMTIGFCIIILFLGFLFSVMLSKKLYAPINSLVDNVKNKLQHGTNSKFGVNEISFLSSAFSKVIEKADALDTLKRNNFQTLKNDFLKDIILGNTIAKIEDLCIRFDEFGVTIDPKDKILLCILKIDDYKHFMEIHDDKDRSLFKFAVTNISEEIMRQNFAAEIVNMGNDHFCVLLNSNNDINQIINESNSMIKSSIMEIQKHIHSYYNLSLSAAIGYITEDISKISSSYNEAMNISLYRIKYGYASIIFPGDLNEVNDDNFSFPASKEKLLLDSIKLGNFENAKDAYYNIVSTISMYSYDSIISSIIYLTFSIYNCIRSIEKNSSCKFSFDFNVFSKHISSLETFEQINETFIKLFREIINSLNDVKSSKSDKLIMNVMNIINANYQDKNLCLNSIASSMKMSSMYLGRLFKDATSKSIAEYITELRLEKVVHLIDSSNLSISEIIDKSGFEKTNYFYTTFKKHFGVSLSEYKLSKSTFNEGGT